MRSYQTAIAMACLVLSPAAIAGERGGVSVVNLMPSCFAIEVTKIALSERWANVDIRYLDKNTAPSAGVLNVDTGGCQCSLTRSKVSARFVVFYGGRTDGARNGKEIVTSGELANIPDLEIYNRAKRPLRKDYDQLPKQDRIGFAVSEPPTADKQYVVELWCG